MAHGDRLVLDLGLEQKIQQVAKLPGDVLILGPPGTGKSEVARWIHAWSGLKGKLVPHNSATGSNDLSDRELFGHVKGAFTGAIKDAPGLVAAADGGTLFLDEIGDMPLAVQAKLLTLLQTRKYRRLGETEERISRFRLIAATNRNLVELCKQGLFREDLYSRINQFPIELPALRDRPDLVHKIAVRELDGMTLPEGHREQALAAVGRLSRQPGAWRFNVRDLQNFLRRCHFDVAEQERLLVEEWARWQGSPKTAPIVSSIVPRGPSMADRERYAGLLQQGVGQAKGTRPKAAGSRKGALALASRLLQAFPGAVPMAEVQAILGVLPRSVDDSLAPLEERGLVRIIGDGVVAVWPPASATLFERRDGAWAPVGEGAIVSVSHGDRVHIRLTTRCAGTLGVAIVTHGQEGPPVPRFLLEGQDLRPSKSAEFDIRFDGEGGLEQILLHVGLPAARGGELVAPLLDEAVMPDSEALERGRRQVLDRWREGWLHEVLVFHSRRT